MTAVPPQLQGSQAAPNSLEFLWEKHRRNILTVGFALLCAIGANYAYRYYNQRQVDAVWTAFASAAKLQSAYDNQLTGNKLGQDEFQKAAMSMASELEQQISKAEMKDLEQSVQSASHEQKPWFLWLLANKAKSAKEWDKALGSLDTLEKEFKAHSLCRETDYPIQYRKEEKPDETKEKPKAGAEPKLLPATKGSAVSILRAQITQLRNYQEPPQLKQVAIPADAPKIKIKFSNQGEVTFALLPGKAPKTVEAVLKLVAEPEGSFWKGMRIDQIQRPSTKFNPYMAPAAMQFHFGYVGSKGDNRDTWTDKEPSKNQVDFEENDLSHFPGALAASMTSDAKGDSKSEVDRLWVCATDAVDQDGARVVFGYAVEGLDVLKKICEASLSSEQEEQSGRGKPQDNITIESVTKL